MGVPIWKYLGLDKPPVDSIEMKMSQFVGQDQADLVQVDKWLDCKTVEGYEWQPKTSKVRRKKNKKECKPLDEKRGYLRILLNGKKYTYHRFIFGEYLAYYNYDFALLRLELRDKNGRYYCEVHHVFNEPLKLEYNRIANLVMFQREEHKALEEHHRRVLQIAEGTVASQLELFKDNEKEQNMEDIRRRISELTQEENKLRKLRDMKKIDSVEYAKRVAEIEEVIDKLWRLLNEK